MLFEGIRLALASIWSQKLRTFLTVLANIVAVSSVIAVVSIVGGMDTYVREKIAGEGTGIVTIRRVDQLKILSSLDEFIKSLRNPRLTLRDVDYIRANVTNARLVDASVSQGARVAYRKRYLDGIRVQGRYADYPVLRDWTLAAGRHFSRLEVQSKSNVVVIGWDVAKNLFPDEDPLDKMVKIGRRPFRIVGIVEEQANILGQNQNRFLVTPITSFQKVYGTRSSVNILVQAADLGTIDETVEEVTSYMRIRHRLRPGDRNDFEVTTAEGLVSLWKGISSSIFMVLIVITSISLVIGGIVIMNIMLVSVTERTREIGIRKALGAKRTNVLWQMLVESMTLSSVGGVIGITMGFVVASVVGLLSPLPYTIAPWAIVAGLVVTVATGIFFGIYPANKAARLDPIEALRHE